MRKDGDESGKAQAEKDLVLVKEGGGGGGSIGSSTNTTSDLEMQQNEELMRPLVKRDNVPETSEE